MAYKMEFFCLFPQAILFGLAYYAQTQRADVQQFKRAHPLVFSVGVFCLGYFVIYQMGCIIVFLLGVVLPVAFALLHSSLR